MLARQKALVTDHSLDSGLLSLFSNEPHIPGMYDVPSNKEKLRENVKRAPSPTRPQEWESNEAYQAGLELYEAHYFWEAHEVWEEVWGQCRPNSAERYLLQGLIQLSNLALKLEMGRVNAARRLVPLARNLFQEVAYAGHDHFMGVNSSDMMQQLLELEKQLLGGEAKLIAYPVINAHNK